MNSPFAISCASDAADWLLDNARDDDARVKLAYLRCYARPASDDEVKAALAFIAGLSPSVGGELAERYRWSTFVQALLSSAEFRCLK